MNKRRWSNSLIALLLVLSACSSPTPAAVPTPTSSPVPSASPTPPATATVTAVPPTATQASTATPAASSATAPTSTAAPSSTSTGTPDPLHTACDHPYWPLRLGAIWHLKTTNAVYTETVSAVTGDQAHAVAILADQYSTGFSQKVQIVCDKDGLAFDAATVAYADGHTGAKNIVESTGRFLIAPDKLVPGAKWSWSLTSNNSLPAYDKGVFTQQSMYRNVSSQDCTLTKTDTLTLTVGVFPAVWVDCKGTSISTSNGTTATYPFNAQLVYALGVGPNGDATMSYTIP